MFQMGRFKQPTAMAGRTSVNPTATQTFFSLRNLCGQGKGAGRELRWQRMQGSGWQSTDKHPFATFYLNSLQISPFLTKDVFWKMKLHIEDSAIFDGYSACLQISA